VALRLQLMDQLGLTWTEVTSLSLWEIGAMTQYISDRQASAALRERLK
jgi:hypothetical protein